MAAEHIAHLLRRIVYRALPLGAAFAMGGCECPTSTSEETYVLKVNGDRLSKARGLAGADGAIDSRSCELVCSYTYSDRDEASLRNGYGYYSGGGVSYQACSFSDTAPAGGSDPIMAADAATSEDSADPADVAEASDAATNDDAGTTSGAPVRTGPFGYVTCVAKVTSSCDGVGRRVAGDAIGPRSDDGSPIGRYFAEASAIEVTAAHAFSALAMDLEVLGAPAALVIGARNAALQERQHARLTQRVARRHGGSPRAAALSASTGRSLADIAIENAAEGCVTETWGAVVASWQAEWATDESVRAAMRTIAPDETSHAEWSWALHRWAWPRLSERDQRRVAMAARRSIAALRERAREPRTAELHARAGLPTPTVCAALLDDLERTVWTEPEWTKPERTKAPGDAGQGSAA